MNTKKNTQQPKKKRNIVPRKKVREVFLDVHENGTPVSVAMKKVGYSPKTARIPQKVTESRSWEELKKEYIPLNELAEVHKKLLRSKTLLQMHFPEDTSREEIREILEEAGGKLIRVIVSEVTYPGKAGKDDITVIKQIAYYSVENSMIQDKVLDKGYKVHGAYAAEKKEVTHKGFSIKALFTGSLDEDEYEED